MGISERYRFNDLGNLTEYYAEENGMVTKAEQHDFVKYEKDNVTYAKESTLYKTPLIDFKFIAEITEKVTLDQFNNPTKKETFTDAKALDNTKTNYSSVTEYTYDDNRLLVGEKTTVTTIYPNNSKIVTNTAIKTYNYNAQGNVVRTESYVVGEELTNGKTIEETVYDDKGNAIKSFTYNSLDSSSKFYSESEYAENGQVTAETDETGENKTKLEYADGTSIVRSQTLPNGSKFAYGHDISDRITAITQSTEEGEENSTQTAYTCGEVTELRSGNNVVNYTYDHKRRKTAIDINGAKDYFTFAYEDNIKENGKTARKTTVKFINGDIATTIT
ncbi:MAG: hypothetical protein OSJ68_10660, partial [Clostridia bacterium]|nr:hypothetical protein [Clostridia bacterium]